ncbi:MAG: YadA C-terminal domain-containing protein, partial [Sphingopyxis sp.]
QTRAQQLLQANQRIASVETAQTQLTTSLQTEITQRMAADLALGNRVTALENRFAEIDFQLDRLESRITSSTAIAVAMGGNAFLPDRRFNLTANVATYSGAHAGSIQLGVLLTPNVAVNAGVATGFNRRGSTAARAGVTFGW